FFVFTDDVPHVYRTLGKLNYEIIETGNSVLDFALLSSCKHQIIANSTFSWWASFLNPNPSKIVVGPAKWSSSVNPNLFTTHTIK
ncbi:MAG TPA: alpha-1,2-fucosyltransferase, partial [Saprospiraceae bacterium]|nr:alpha-1,2-fucosyltransferase [Saprospiraceae bacterium]